MLCVGTAWAADEMAAPGASVVKGEVLEVKDVGNYTYLRLKTDEGETWAAVGKAPVTPGSRVIIEEAMVMEDFESKSLQKTFDKIVFGVLGGFGHGMTGSPGVAETASGD